MIRKSLASMSTSARLRSHMAPVWHAADLGHFNSIQRSIDAVDRLQHLLSARLHHRDRGLHVQPLDLRERRDVTRRHGELEAIALVVDADDGDPLAGDRILCDRRQQAAVRCEARIAEVPRGIVIDDLRHAVGAVGLVRHHLAGHTVEDELGTRGARLPRWSFCASRFADLARISAADTVARLLTMGTTTARRRASPPRPRGRSRQHGASGRRGAAVSRSRVAPRGEEDTTACSTRRCSVGGHRGWKVQRPHGTRRSPPAAARAAPRISRRMPHAHGHRRRPRYPRGPEPGHHRDTS